jgi:hypothetical protein
VTGASGESSQALVIGLVVSPSWRETGPMMSFWYAVISIMSAKAGCAFERRRHSAGEAYSVETLLAEQCRDRIEDSLAGR